MQQNSINYPLILNSERSLSLVTNFEIEFAYIKGPIPTA